MKIAHIHVWDKDNRGDHAIVIAVQDLIKKVYPKCQITDFPIEALHDESRANLIKINSHDLVVVGGGGIFYSYFLPYNGKMINQIKIPIAIFGTGYIREIGGRKLKDDETKSIIALTNKAKVVGVRDYYTKRFLEKNKSKAQVELVGDPAIALEAKKPKNFELKKDKIKIGVNLNYSGWLGFGKWHNEIISSYTDVIQHFVKKHDAQIIYFKHHPGEDNIIPKLPTKYIEVADMPPKNLMYLYSQCDLMVGMMLHSCVMAFGANCPEINVAYDIRNKNFGKFINCPELVMNLENLKKGALLKKAKTVFKNKEAYKNKFAKRKNKLENRQIDFVKKFSNLI